MMFAVIGFILGAVLATVLCSLRHGGLKCGSSKRREKSDHFLQSDHDSSSWIQRTDSAGIPDLHMNTSSLHEGRVVKRRWDTL